MGIFDLFRKNKKRDEKNKKNKNSTVSVNITIKSKKNETQNQLIGDNIISANHRKKDCYRSSQGLYPHEILVLSYAETFKFDQTDFQNFWWYCYGIKDVKKILDDMRKKDYLKIGSIRKTISQETVVRLKDLLRNSNLKVSGRKSELIDRIMNNIDHNILEKTFERNYYELTKKGRKSIEEGEYVRYIHRNSIQCLDIWSLNKLIGNSSPKSFRDKIWGYLNKCCEDYIIAGKYENYRFCRYDMYKFLVEEEKWNNALFMIAEVIYYCLSGIENDFNVEMLDIYSEHYFPYEDSFVTITPGILNSLVDCRNHLDITNKELRDTLIIKMNKLSIPFHLFTIEECCNIAICEIEENINDLKKIYRVAENRFMEEYMN